MSELKVNRITDTSGSEVLRSDSGTWTVSASFTQNFTDSTLTNPTLSGTMTGGTISSETTGTHSGPSTGTHSGPSAGTHSGPVTGAFSGTFTSSATFPVGHVIGVYTDTFTLSTGSVDILSAGVNWDGLDVSIPATSTSNKIIVQVHIAGVTNKGVAARSVLAGLKYSTDDWANAYTLGPNDLVVQPAAYADGNVRESLSFQLPVTVPTTSAFRIRTRLIGQNGDIEVHAATDGVSSMVVWLIQG